jgi:hypothetical protein
MPLGKREFTQIERRLITTLTDACETAKTDFARFEANINLRPSDHTVRLDAEEECQRIHSGDWQKCLAQPSVTKG